MARGHEGAVALPTVSFSKVDDGYDEPGGVHDQQARSYGYNDFSVFKPTDSYIRFIEPLESELAIQVEYDMDEQDQEWLDLVNTERKNSQISTIAPETFEIIMDRLEKEWFDLTKNIPKPDMAMPSEDSTCAICDDSEGENTNAIVFCDGCNLAVHQDCYGVPYIPEGQWLCRKCTVSPEMPVSCLLCPNEGGAFKQTDTGKWVHLLCAIWVPETHVTNETFMEPVEGVDKISKQRWKLICSICKVRHGAYIQCAKQSCFTAYHPTCARKEKLLMPMKAREGSEPGALTCFCDKHLPLEQHEIRMAALAKEQQDNAAEDGKLSKAARAYAKTYKPGPPLVPNLIIERIINYTSKIKKPKLAEFVYSVCKYWSQKREARRGAPLLKRLHLEPWTASTGGKLQTDKEKKMKLEHLQRLREDFEGFKQIAILVRQREEAKLEQMDAISNVMSRMLYPHEKSLGFAFEKLMSMDRQHHLRDPVSKVEVPDYYNIIHRPMCWKQIEEKLEKHQYWDLQTFKDDINLVIDNALLYNKNYSPIHKVATRLKAAAEPILSALDKHMTEPPMSVDVTATATSLFPETQIGDLEPPISILQLLISTAAISEDYENLLVDEPIESLLKFELAVVKLPPKEPTPPRESTPVVEEGVDVAKVEGEEGWGENVLEMEVGEPTEDAEPADAVVVGEEDVMDATMNATNEDDQSGYAPASKSTPKPRKPKKVKPAPRVRDRAAEKQRAAERAAVAATLAALDESPGFRARKTRNGLAIEATFLEEAEGGPSSSTSPKKKKRDSLTSRTVEFEAEAMGVGMELDYSQPSSPGAQEAGPSDEANKKRKRAPRLSVIPPPAAFVEDFDEQESFKMFKMFEQGWILPHGQKRGAAKRSFVNATTPPPVKRQRPNVKSRLSVAATPALDNETLDGTEGNDVMDVDNASSVRESSEEASPITLIPGVHNIVHEADGTVVLEEVETPALRRERARLRKLQASAAKSAPSKPAGQDGDDADALSDLTGISSDEGENGEGKRSASLASALSEAAAPSRSVQRSTIRKDSKGRKVVVDDLGAIDWQPGQTLEGGTLVWAKSGQYPWWPATVFQWDDAGNDIPQDVLDVGVKARKRKNGDSLQLVLFYDKAKTWQWCPPSKLRLFGENDELDEDLIAANSVRQRWSSNQRKECLDAYRLAREEQEDVGAVVDEPEEPPKKTSRSSKGKQKASQDDTPGSARLRGRGRPRKYPLPEEAEQFVHEPEDTPIRRRGYASPSPMPVVDDVVPLAEDAVADEWVW